MPGTKNYLIILIDEYIKRINFKKRCLRVIEDTLKQLEEYNYKVELPDSDSFIVRKDKDGN